MDVKSLHFQSVACPRMRTLVLQTMDFQSIVVDLSLSTFCRGYFSSGLIQAPDPAPPVAADGFIDLAPYFT